MFIEEILFIINSTYNLKTLHDNLKIDTHNIQKLKILIDQTGI